MQLASRGLIESIEIDGTVALIAQYLDKGGSALFLRWLELAVGHAQEMHLQGFDQKILGIPTIRTGQRQNSTPQRGNGASMKPGFVPNRAQSVSYPVRR